MSIKDDLSVAAKRWKLARTLPPALAGGEAERQQLRNWFERLQRKAPDSLVAGAEVFEIESSQLPWLDTGIDLREGEWVSTFAAGRVVLSNALDIWVGPQFQLWMRVGELGEIFNGTRDTYSFQAPSDGRLYLAGCFPGQWHDRSGRVSTSLDDYAKFSGGLSVAVLRWKVPAEEAFAMLSGDERIAGEALRLASPVPAPEGWSYLWFLGQSEIFRQARDEQGEPCIGCHTERDVAILQHDAVFDLRPDTTLSWRWKVDELPSVLPENTQASHDYLSVAIEFENGRDITYTWSPELPSGTGYWCPLATWKDREFHVVVRSGEADLGKWLLEERNLYADYRHYMGEPPKRIVRIWLIAVSLFQRRRGRALFRDFRFQGGGRTLLVDQPAQTR